MSTVAMAQSPPATFSSNVSNGSETVTVDFTQHPIRSGNFQVLVQDSSGTFTTHTPAASRIYFGTVQDHPGAIAAGLLKSSGTLICRIYFESGVEWSSTGGTASVRGSTNWTPAWPTTLVPAGGAGATVYVAELGIDASNDQYVARLEESAEPVAALSLGRVPAVRIFVLDEKSLAAVSETLK